MGTRFPRPIPDIPKPPPPPPPPPKRKSPKPKAAYGYITELTCAAECDGLMRATGSVAFTGPVVPHMEGGEIAIIPRERLEELEKLEAAPSPIFDTVGELVTDLNAANKAMGFGPPEKGKAPPNLLRKGCELRKIRLGDGREQWVIIANRIASRRSLCRIIADWFTKPCSQPFFKPEGESEYSVAAFRQAAKNVDWRMGAV